MNIFTGQENLPELVGPGVGPMAASGLLGCVQLRILPGGPHAPTLGERQRRLKHMMSSLDIGLQMFCLSAKFAFPFGFNSYSSISSFCSHPASCLVGFPWVAGWV